MKHDWNRIVTSRKKIETVKELLFWSYSNLAMADAAKQDGSDIYLKIHYIIRQRLFSGLMSNTMTVGSIVREEKAKLSATRRCCYCYDETAKLTIDHLIPRFKDGPESSDNIVWCCRSCNSSKGKKDLLEWMFKKNKFPSVQVLRRYLKLAIHICKTEGIFENKLTELPHIDHSIVTLTLIPRLFPKPKDIVR